MISWIAQHDWVAWILAIIGIGIDIIIASGIIAARREAKQLKQKLDNINIRAEHGLVQYFQTVTEMLKVNPNMKNPYKPIPSPEEGKITVDTIKLCMFNFIQNTLNLT